MADNTFTIKIITPNRVFYTGEATMVEFNTTEGEIGIYRNHIPRLYIRNGRCNREGRTLQ